MKVIAWESVAPDARAALLQRLGVEDPLWLRAVRDHHAVPEVGGHTDLDRPVLLHGAIAAGVDVYRSAGIALADTLPVIDPEGKTARKTTDFAGELVIAPPSAAGSAWLRRFRHAQHGFASGCLGRCTLGHHAFERFQIGQRVDFHAAIVTEGSRLPPGRRDQPRSLR